MTKLFISDTFSVLTNILQVQMVCGDLKNFGQSGQIFKCTVDKIFPGKKFGKLD